MRHQVEPLKRLGFSAATAGIGEESDGGEVKVTNCECEIESFPITADLRCDLH